MGEHVLCTRDGEEYEGVVVSIDEPELDADGAPTSNRIPTDPRVLFDGGLPGASGDIIHVHIWARDDDLTLNPDPGDISRFMAGRMEELSVPTPAPAPEPAPTPYEQRLDAKMPTLPRKNVYIADN